MSKNKYECTWNKGNKEEKYGLTYEKLKSQYSVITNKGLKRQNNNNYSIHQKSEVTVKLER